MVLIDVCTREKGLCECVVLNPLLKSPKSLTSRGTQCTDTFLGGKRSVLVRYDNRQCPVRCHYLVESGPKRTGESFAPRYTNTGSRVVPTTHPGPRVTTGTTVWCTTEVHPRLLTPLSGVWVVETPLRARHRREGRTGHPDGSD